MFKPFKDLFFNNKNKINFLLTFILKNEASSNYYSDKLNQKNINNTKIRIFLFASISIRILAYILNMYNTIYIMALAIYLNTKTNKTNLKKN